MYISWENSIHPTIIHLFFIIILLGFLRGVWDERMKHFIKYLLYVNIQVTGVFNTLYSVAYLFQYITRDVIVYCFDAILFLCLFIITYYYFCIWLICFLFLFCLFVCLFVVFFRGFFSCHSLFIFSLFFFFFFVVLGFVVRWWGGKTLLYINKFLAYWLMVIFSFFCCTFVACYALWGRGE